MTRERTRENNICSFVTDAIIWAYRDKVNEHGGKYNLAIINSGGLRAELGVGKITLEDVMTILPFDSTFDLVRVKGRHLIQAFEHSVSRFNKDGWNRAGQFLQVSGFKLVYDIQKPVGQRLVSAKVLGDDGYTDVEDDVEYDILINSYIAGGGDGYEGISNNKLKYEIGPLDTDVIRQYLAASSPVNPRVKGNIVFKVLDDDDDDDTDDDNDGDGNCWTLPVPGLDLSVKFCGWKASLVYQ